MFCLHFFFFSQNYVLEGIVSNTVIDWFFPWPQDALADVAEYMLKDVEIPKDHKPNIIKHIVRVHKDVSQFSSK